MRRSSPTALNVDSDDKVYELEVSPRSSLDSVDLKSTSLPDLPKLNIPQPTSQHSPPAPTIRLLFSLLSRKHFFTLLLPAIISSIISGGIAPFMTYVIGQAFDAFALFPTGPSPSQQAKEQLLHAVGLAALELVGLAVGSFALGSLTSCLWIWAGEINVMSLRTAVYHAVTEKDMDWFDSNLGTGDSQPTDGESPQSVGAGGLMANFTRETDDVRMASSLASGRLVQYLTTCIACLILAFMRSWQLTFVILSAVPVLVFVQGLSQSLAGPILAYERTQTGVAATLVERAVSAISTVKAFNATPNEHQAATKSFSHLQAIARRLNGLWGLTSGLGQFIMMAMFVQGFWFGAKLVRDGKASAGDVMAVFWACLIATSNLQMCIPQLIVLAKGKAAASSLIGLIGDNSFRNHNGKSRTLRKIVPTRFTGEIALHNVTFAYPSRPTVPVLTNVSLFIPAHETTFVVGSSGSGKSTVAQLLMKMYTPQQGTITFDEQDIRYLDETWYKAHVGCVGQQGAAGVVILDGKSVAENIALALLDRKASSLEVEDACRAALLHDFVRDLPQGYDTILGASGVGLSGGQKQRLAMARARLRNPDVLILDEATSALDATSRILVFEALKRWRLHKTTIVITHDLSQIVSEDFVYVLKHGHVVEQGYRADLEKASSSSRIGSGGEFRKMLEAQTSTGGFIPVRDAEGNDVQDFDDEELEDEADTHDTSVIVKPNTQSIISVGNWMLDVVADLTAGRRASLLNEVIERRADACTPLPKRAPRPLSIQIPSTTVQHYNTLTPIAASPMITSPDSQLTYPYPSEYPSPPDPAYTLTSKRFSLPFTPTSATFTTRSTAALIDDLEFDHEKNAMERSADSARRGREGRARTRWDGARNAPMTDIKVESLQQQANSNPAEVRPTFWKLMRSIYPTVPYKPVLFLGLLACIASGAMTPVFSFLLSGLLFQVSTGAQDAGAINRAGGVVLAVAAFDGILLGTKYFLMETVGMGWVTRIRSTAYTKILGQDRSWFDKSDNSPPKIVQILVKDADDARDLIAIVWAQCLVVITMLSVGLIWALVRGWQLTLVGFAIAPVFACTMTLQTRLVSNCELRNKRAREEVAKGYYESILNIRSIRAMAFEGIFKSQFNKSAEKALHTGVRGALVEGCTYGVASGLIYLAEALLFYVGAVLISRGTYSYLQMVQVLNLVVFTVTIGSQLMAFTNRIAKSVQAASDFKVLMDLNASTNESKGFLRPQLEGHIQFRNVNFTYPERLEAPVLRNVNLQIANGECVAVVGASGSGKSTLAALLQRLYEPSAGRIILGDYSLDSIDVRYLRDHVSVVSQQPHLFDASIAENIRYGGIAISDVDIRTAAKKAQIHDFIMSLPQGYDTIIGENASLLSGGQAQRLQIARALARPSRVLILDECTSALDPENQAAVLETIREAKVGRTTVMVTHKLQVMMMCDRILVLSDGEVAEQGTYEELMERRGVFATLASGGEWVSD